MKGRVGISDHGRAVGLEVLLPFWYFSFSPVRGPAIETMVEAALKVDQERPAPRTVFNL